MVVLYAIISVLNLIRAATGSQCKETKRGVTCSFGLVEDQSCRDWSNPNPYLYEWSFCYCMGAVFVFANPLNTP